MQGLIIAFIIIAFLFNVYKNFKKEAKEAEARAKAAAEQQKALEQEARAQSFQKSVYERVVKEQELTTQPVFVSNKDDYIQEKRVKDENRAAGKHKKNQPVLDYYNPELPVAEIVENRRIHEPHKHGYKPVERKKRIVTNFNAKQALIYEAILRRPQY